MAEKEITLEELKKELEELPNIEREIAIELAEKDKRDLSRRRSQFLGSRGLR